MSPAERLILENQELMLNILQRLLSTPGVWADGLNTTDARAGKTITPINAQRNKIAAALQKE